MDPSIQYSTHGQIPYNQPAIQQVPAQQPVMRKVTPARKAVGAVGSPGSPQALPLQQRNSISGSSISSQNAASIQANSAAHRASTSSFSSGVSSDQITSGLPPGWEVLYTPDGKPYYSNHVTKATTWTKPEMTPSPLPAGWEERKTPDGKVYYCHLSSQNTQWERPTPDQVQQEKILVSPTQPTVYSVKAELATGVAPLPPHWEERRTAEGKVYYCNTLAQTTQWERPRAVTQQPQQQQVRAVSNPVVGGAQVQQVRPTLTTQQQAFPTGSPIHGQPRVHNAQITPRPLMHANTTTSVPTRNMVNQNVGGQHPRLTLPVQTLQSQLPPGWEERRTKEGKVYYCNVPAQTTQWDRPQMPNQQQFSTQKIPVTIASQLPQQQPQLANAMQSMQIANQQAQQFSTQKQVVNPVVSNAQPHQANVIQPQNHASLAQQFSTQKQVVIPAIQHAQIVPMSTPQANAVNAQPQQQQQQFSTQKQVINTSAIQSQPQNVIQAQAQMYQQPQQGSQHIQQPLAVVAIPNVQATKNIQPQSRPQFQHPAPGQPQLTSELPVQATAPVSPMSPQLQQVQSAPVALWEVRTTIEGDPYFYNTQTKVKTWELPPQSNGYFAMVPQAHIVPEHLIAPEQSVQVAASISAQPVFPVASSLPPGWEERRTTDGKVYYCNVLAQTAQWEHPIPSLIQTTSHISAGSSNTSPSDVQQLKKDKRKSTFGLGALTSSKTMQKMKLPASAKSMTESSIKGLKTAGKYVKDNKGKVLGVAAGAGLASVLLKETLGIEFGDDEGGGGEEVVMAEAAPMEQTYYESVPLEQQVYEPVQYDQQAYEQVPYEQAVYEQPPIEQQTFEQPPIEQQAYEPVPLEQQVYENQFYESQPIEETFVFQEQPYQESFVPVEEPLQPEEQVFVSEEPPAEEPPTQEDTEQQQPAEEPVQQEPVQEQPPAQEPPPQDQAIDSDAQSEAEGAAEEAAEQQQERQEQALAAEEQALEESQKQQEDSPPPVDSDIESEAEELSEEQHAQHKHSNAIHKMLAAAAVGGAAANSGGGSGGNEQAVYITGGESADQTNDLEALKAQQMMEAQGRQNALALI